MLLLGRDNLRSLTKVPDLTRQPGVKAVSAIDWQSPLWL
jgi:hypothetical protein